MGETCPLLGASSPLTKIRCVLQECDERRTAGPLCGKRLPIASQSSQGHRGAARHRSPFAVPVTAVRWGCSTLLSAKALPPCVDAAMELIPVMGAGEDPSRFLGAPFVVVGEGGEVRRGGLEERA